MASACTNLDEAKSFKNEKTSSTNEFLVKKKEPQHFHQTLINFPCQIAYQKKKIILYQMKKDQKF